MKMILMKMKNDTSIYKIYTFANASKKKKKSAMQIKHKEANLMKYQIVTAFTV